MSIFKKPNPKDPKDIKLKNNPFNDPALSEMKQSMKNDLMADSVFTKNSKLTSYSTTSELMNNSSKFKKFVNNTGTFLNPRVQVQNRGQTAVYFQRFRIWRHGIRVPQHRRPLHVPESENERFSEHVLDFSLDDQQANS